MFRSVFPVELLVRHFLGEFTARIELLRVSSWDEGNFKKKENGFPGII